MAQDLGWWSEVVFGGWRGRPGPRYLRLATAIIDAVQEGFVIGGTRVPAERRIAEALGVSRGTVVACFDHLVAAGVLRRRQGAGTFVVGRPSWTERQPVGSVAALLLRRMATAADGIDLSVSAPGRLGHLPSIDTGDLLSDLDGHGLDPAGCSTLRTRIAQHLTHHQQLPTTAEQVIVTAGAQEALTLVARVVADRTTPLLTSCPTYPGLAGAVADRTAGVSLVPADTAGVVPEGLERCLERDGGGVVYLAPTGHNPTGSVVPDARRRALATVADRGRCVVVEDLALADLYFDGPPPAPVASRSDAVIVVGTLSKVLWAGLRIGWVRAEPDLLRALLAHKAALNLATAAPAQVVAARLLASIDRAWLDRHRAALAVHRDHLVAAIGAQLPAWRCLAPAAGLSLWVQLPVVNADPFASVASRHGVTVAPGSTACLCGDHHQALRLSFAEPLETLDLAVERLRSAWESYSEDLAASPARRRTAS